MPNWCESELTVSSNNVEQLRQFVQLMGDTTRGTQISLQKLLPVPEELYDAPDKENGMPATVEWKISNWGTFCDFAAEASWISDNCIKYVYSTKWWPAVEWIKYAAHLYPDLEFTLNYDCWEFSYFGIFRAHGMTSYNEFHKTKPEEAMILASNAERDGQKQFPVQEFCPETAVMQKQRKKIVNADVGDKPVFSFEMIKFD